MRVDIAVQHSSQFIRRLVLLTLVALLPGILRAQMVVTGHVSANGMPVEGATVTVSELRIETRTTSNGAYSFIVRSAFVNGQTVTLIARHRRFGMQSVRIALSGTDLVQDLVLGQPGPVARPPAAVQPGANRVPVVSQPRRPDSLRASPPNRAFESVTRLRSVDSLFFANAVGQMDVGRALAGRVPGLLVTGAPQPGGSSLIVFRGPRSTSGSVQPLFVVDGIPIDNAGFGEAAQRFGLGGFDYGTPLSDLSLDDIASAVVMSPAEAALRFGARAANGVILITTKRAHRVTGVAISGAIRGSAESPGRLPSYQNQYGQGLGGAFEFFDGRGRGINDAVDQSWGPKLQGQPIAQASTFEPMRPDVRHWLPHPSGVGDYFNRGTTADAQVVLEAAREAARVRASLTGRNSTGLTPNAVTRRAGLALQGSAEPTSRLGVSGQLQLIRSEGFDRPGTGFDETNPVAGFTRMGRQVDMTALRAHMRDTSGQINWIYTSRNNPFIQSLVNSNDDHRGHTIGGGQLTFALSRWLSATLNAGTDNYHEARSVQIASDWKGGFPSAMGRGDFSGGGATQQKNSSAERLADLALRATRGQTDRVFLTGTAGVEVRRTTYEQTNAIIDSSEVTGTRASSGSVDRGSHSVQSGYLIGTLERSDALALTAGVRMEQASRTGITAAGMAVFPSVSASYDAAKGVSFLQEVGLGVARVHASWWRAGNEVTPRTLRATYGGAGTTTLTGLGLPELGISGPERTNAIEVGTLLATSGRRASLDLTWYREKSSELLVPGNGPVLMDPQQTGLMSNQGVETQLRIVPLQRAGREWDLTASFAHNVNYVDRLGGDQSQVVLGPSIWGTSLVARVGQPLGVIVGSRPLRDPASQSLLLKGGLPIPDPNVSVLGSWQPDWTTSVSSRIRVGQAQLSMLVDARFGGELFSATNLWGSYAGTLTSTVAWRDSGLVVAGLDSVSRAANTTKVSAEDYYHALAGITEPWVYDATYAKLREVRLSYDLRLGFVPGLIDQTARISLVARNLATWAKAPNIDPENAMSAGVFQGFEMGQLPSARSVGMQISIAP